MIITLTTIVTIVSAGILSCPPAMEIGSMEIIDVNDFGSDFHRSIAEFCRRKLTPIAVIRTASEGADRSGR